MSKMPILVGTVVGLCAISATAPATSNVQLDFSEITKASSTILTGEVLKTSTKMQGKAATTHVSVKVMDELKGDAEKVITVVVPGGSYRSGRFRIGETSPGTPAAFRDQQNLYFLSEGQKAGTYNVTGQTQGVMNLQPSAEGAVVKGSITQGEPMSIKEMKVRINSVEGE